MTSIISSATKKKFIPKNSDIIFTRKTIAGDLLEKIIQKFPDDFKDVVYAIEPSAGNGAFVDHLKSKFSNVIALDIAPKREDIFKQDFFEWIVPNNVTQNNSICVGNLPFSIAKQFLKRCGDVSNRIIMILPQSFHNSIPTTALGKDWKVEHKELLDGSVFVQNKKIHACFLYLKRVDGYERPNLTKVVPEGFSIVSFPNTNYQGEPDLIFWQSGGNAGKRTRRDSINNSRAYGIVFEDGEKKRRVLESDCTIEQTRGTNNRSYITTDAICKVLNPI